MSIRDRIAAEASREYPRADTDGHDEAGREGYTIGAEGITAELEDILAHLPRNPDDWGSDDCFSVTYALAELLGRIPKED